MGDVLSTVTVTTNASHCPRPWPAWSRSLSTVSRPGPAPAPMVSILGSGSSLGHSLSLQVWRWWAASVVNWIRVLQINSFCLHSLPWDLFLSTLFEVPNKQFWEKIKPRNSKNKVLRILNRTFHIVHISTNLQDSAMHQWAGNFKYESTHAPQGTRLAAHI